MVLSILRLFILYRCYAAKTTSEGSLVLVKIDLEANECSVLCEKMMLGSNLLKALKPAIGDSSTA